MNQNGPESEKSFDWRQSVNLFTTALVHVDYMLVYVCFTQKSTARDDRDQHKAHHYCHTV